MIFRWGFNTQVYLSCFYIPFLTLYQFLALFADLPCFFVVVVVVVVVVLWFVFSIIHTEVDEPFASVYYAERKLKNKNIGHVVFSQDVNVLAT